MKGLRSVQDGPIEIYRPRAVAHRGIWDVGGVRFKVHDLLADGQVVSGDTVAITQQFLKTEVLKRVADMGESNGLGFVILHPGDLGLSIAAQWWAQGSVLCQHIYRKTYDGDAPLDTIARPVVGCVWELAIIQAEQAAWRATMMQAKPDPEAYLAARVGFDVA
ncbi:MAG: hypothetical protein AAFW87_10390 [Pseudomonadota bacterium]